MVVKRKSSKVSNDPSSRFHQQRRPTYFLGTYVYKVTKINK